MQEHFTFQAPLDALQDKIILVTGASDGIGREAALTYAKHGATVLLLARNVKKMEAVYDDIVALGAPEPMIIPFDLKEAKKEHYAELSAQLISSFGQLDGLLHSAGILGVLSPLAHIQADTWDDVMQINVTAPFLLTQAMLPALEKAPSASVIFTSSGVGRTGRAHWGSYAVSKFATEGLSQVIADEYEGSTLRFNVINPGATRTKMRAQAFPAENAELLKTPADLMPTYLYLMSDASLGVTGASLNAQ